MTDPVPLHVSARQPDDLDAVYALDCLGFKFAIATRAVAAVQGELGERTNEVDVVLKRAG